jgi:hypothetical protein
MENDENDWLAFAGPVPCQRRLTLRPRWPPRAAGGGHARASRCRQGPVRVLNARTCSSTPTRRAQATAVRQAPPLAKSSQLRGLSDRYSAVARFPGPADDRRGRRTGLRGQVWSGVIGPAGMPKAVLGKNSGCSSTTAASTRSMSSVVQRSLNLTSLGWDHPPFANSCRKTRTLLFAK